MALSALDDKAVHPTPAELAEVLGGSDEVWRHLTTRMEAGYGPLSVEWSFAGAKYGWSCRLQRKKRTILYLIPQNGAFLVGVVLGDRALTLLRRDDLSAATRELIDQAPRYGEGTGFRIPVSSIADCKDVEVVVEAKMG
jgi:hypothetical protein